MLKHIGEGGSAQVHLNLATGTRVKTNLEFNNAPKNNFCIEAEIQAIAAKAGISPAERTDSVCDGRHKREPGYGV